MKLDGPRLPKADSRHTVHSLTHCCAGRRAIAWVFSTTRACWLAPGTAELNERANYTARVAVTGNTATRHAHYDHNITKCASGRALRSVSSPSQGLRVLG